MNIATITRFTILCLVAFASALQAQNLQLSLEDAQKRALETAKLLKVSKQKVVQAEAKSEENSSAMLPSLKLQGSYNRLSDVGPSQFDNPFSPGTKITLANPVLDNYSLSLTATQILFAGNRLTAAKDIADYSAKAAMYDLQNDKSSTVYNITLTYWALYKARDLRKSANESIKQLEARVKDGENLFKAGMITNNDLLKIKVQLGNVRVMSLDAEQSCNSLQLALNNLIGQPLNTALELSSVPAGSNESSFDIQGAIGEALKTRPDFMANEMRVLAADRGIDAANGGYYPQIAASAQYVYANPNQRIFPSHAEFDGTWALGINLQWDLWNWMTPKHQADQASAQKAQAEEGLSAMRDGMSVEATQNYLALTPAKERIRVAEEALGQATENNSITASRYKAGTATGTEVIESETLLLQSKVNKISAIVDYELAVAKLNRSLGK